MQSDALVSEGGHGHAYLDHIEPVHECAYAFEDVACGEELALLTLHWGAVVLGYQFALAAGCLEVAVAARGGAVVLLVEPVAEALLPQGIGVGVESFILKVVLLRWFDTDDLEGEEAAVGGVVGEEEGVVARSAERGDMGQVLIEAPVGGACADGAHGGERLELVEFLLLHVVNLLQAHEGRLGDVEEVVLGDVAVHEFDEEVTAQFLGQEVVEPSALVLALLTDEDEDAVVDLIGHEESSNEAYEPLAQHLAPLVGIARHGDRRGETADVVGHPVPRGQRADVLLEGVVLLCKVAADD